MLDKLIKHQHPIIFCGTYFAILGGGLAYGLGITTGHVLAAGILISAFLLVSLGTLALNLLTTKITFGLIVKIPLSVLLTFWSYFLVTGLYSIIARVHILCLMLTTNRMNGIN